MSSDTLETLQQLDPNLLADVVRQDQRSATFEITDWAVQPLSHEKIISTTGGLYMFSGHGRDGQEIKPWSIVLKVLNKPPGWCLDPGEWCYWKRELMAFETGMLAGLASALGAPRCYGTLEHPDSGWVWMEHVHESTERVWPMATYRRVARQVGLLGSTFLNGRPLPDYPWLSICFLQSGMADGGWWATFMNPQSEKNAWQSPLVQGAFPEYLRAGVQRIWAEKAQFFQILNTLPQVFCHNDLHRRNLMLRHNPDGQEELIGIDWGFCGIGAVGADMAELAANDMFFFEVDPSQANELEELVLDGYQAGLRDGNWDGDPLLARLGYLVTAVLFMGATMPGWAAIMLPEDSDTNVQAMFGRPRETVLTGWVSLCEFLMERADEARHLARKLGVA